MRRPIHALMAVSLATASAAFGLALAAPAGATSSFSLTRIAGSDRYQTASYIDAATYPSGEPIALLADAIPGHQSDALAASGVEGTYGIGVLLTDNTNTVPTSALSALSANKVSKIVVLGGTGAVSQSQINQLSSAGYQVSEPYQGSDRWQTMEMVDDSMGGAGTDASGLATAILASGQDNHLVDALSAGGLSYLKHFPIILTNSTGPGLQPQAQQVISNLGIKHLIVVGGTASIPSSEYSPPPSGVTKVDVEAGSDRSNTSQVLADFAISSGWLANTNLILARGDDGADALAGAPFGGTHGWPTVVTNSATDVGSAPAFATEHDSTLAGTSYVLGGTGAVTASQASAVQTAGGGPAPTTAPAGTFGTAAGTTPAVTAETSTTFTEGNETYTYASGDTYQIVTTSSTPGSSPACTADSYADFQARLSNGDSVSGNYQPSATSTFCLNDLAPASPSSVTSTTSSTGSGVNVSWTAPAAAGTDAVNGYTIWRAAATQSIPSSGQYSCPAAYTVAPGASPQTPPGSSSGYTVLNTVAVGASSTYTYPDTTATAGNEYCYAVSSMSPNSLAGIQTGTAQPASGSNALQPASPGAVSGAGNGSGGTAPAGTFGTAGGSTPVVTSETASAFTEGNETYTYASGDTYQIVTTSSTPGSSPACTADSYADFQARLSNGDSVSGNYQPSATSTFCLNDLAPQPPSSASASASSSGGVLVSWTAPRQAGADGITGYTIWQTPASSGTTGSYCPPAYTVAAGVSPQTPPSGYTALATVPASSSTYTDTTASAGNSYCYAVSSVAPSGAGAPQAGSATPAPSDSSPSQDCPSPGACPNPVAGASAGQAVSAPVSLSTACLQDCTDLAAGSSPGTAGTELTVTFNEPMTVSAWSSLTLAGPCSTTPGGTCPASASGQATLLPENTSACSPVMSTPTGAFCASASASGDTVTFSVDYCPAPSCSSVSINDLEIVGEAGVNSATNNVPWNVPGSAIGDVIGTSTNACGPGSCSRVFGGANANLPSAPTITGLNQNVISFQCNDPGSTQLNSYNQDGQYLGEATCGGASHPRQSAPGTFVSGSTYLFTETDGPPGENPGNSASVVLNQESQAVSVVDPMMPAMQSATVTSHTPAGLSITYNEPIACATVDADASDYSVSYSGATSGTEAAGFFTASCSGSTVTLTGKSGDNFATSYTLTIKAQKGTDGDTACTFVSPNNTNCEAVGDSTTATT